MLWAGDRRSCRLTGPSLLIVDVRRVQDEAEPAPSPGARGGRSSLTWQPWSRGPQLDPHGPVNSARSRAGGDQLGPGCGSPSVRAPSVHNCLTGKGKSASTDTGTVRPNEPVLDPGLCATKNAGPCPGQPGVRPWMAETSHLTVAPTPAVVA